MQSTHVAKTKALISYAVTVTAVLRLCFRICKSRFSDDAGQKNLVLHPFTPISLNFIYVVGSRHFDIFQIISSALNYPNYIFPG